ncbi:Uncharacterized iron-regulated membrane protein [Sphingobium sp. YR657]|uniref:PepSY domain-containing protein n=1 Tax=Sphingobium yanoikuyae ATCC 51230 TaxID=883163 RepID=K9D948_SPHYA|nr:PepSY-associated TM helix domain-containing protein [Sphingobium yanoikuyae]EKU74045.1 hypothetical protein HMPREF9718_03162 [Sphingobium yanoikuyae ATCC 51230]WQE07496.1 PepSY-associated TM helix domain-containing protein [Sphingobium yanoikuyae]SHM70733.1 Uncharacterized iron-regulated membrane protein [Sphingobium sp. YR657]
MRGARRVLRLWHRCFGIGAGLWLLLLAVTGCAITFYDELDRWLNPDWRHIAQPWTDAPQLDAALANAARRLPAFTPRLIDLPDAPSHSILIVGSLARPGEGPRPAQLFADPRNGHVLGWREGGRLAFDRHHVMDTLYALHMDLMLGETMAWFLGLVALAWVLDHLPAIILAIPRLGKWRTAFQVQGRGFNLRRLFDLHRAPGVWAFPITLTLAITGLCLSWQEEMRSLVSLASPVSERLHYSLPPMSGASHAVPIDPILQQMGVQGRRIDMIQLLPHQGLYAFRAHDPRDLDGMGRLWLYVRQQDGRAAGARHDNGVSAGDHFFAWQYPLHSGKAFGLAGRIAIFCAGIATVLTAITGILLFMFRVDGRRRSREKG